MALFKYTLPSGAEYTLNAPSGTTQAEADNIFYSQVAAGTFVSYRVGDKLTRPEEALANFGLTRLQRGTAGVDDKTLLAVIQGLPLVAPVPTLTNVPIESPINTASFAQANTDLGPDSVGTLSPTQVAALMAQLAEIVNQPADEISEIGIGLYGLSCEQLEAVGIVKPGFCCKFCPADEKTKVNAKNFVQAMNTPSAYTGKYGVTNVNDILSDSSLQNKIQQQLMAQTYNQLVANGTIIPPEPTVSKPSVSTGQIYNSSGTLVQAGALTLVATALGYNGANALFSDFTNLFKSNVNQLSNIKIDPTTISLTNNPIGAITDGLAALGTNAVTQFNSAISSLSTGAIQFADNVTNTIKSGVDQINGIVGSTQNAANAVTTLSSTLNGDIGALVANGSKFGADSATAWAATDTALKSVGVDTTAVNQGIATAKNVASTAQNLYGQGQQLVGSLNSQLKSAMDQLGKASQFSINFADFNLSSLVAKVEPAPAFVNTVKRTVLDQSVARVIGSDKIPTPQFEIPSLASLGIQADIDQAKAYLKAAQTTAQNVQNKVQEVQSQAQAVVNTAQNTQNQIQAFGAQVSNTANNNGLV